MENTSNLYALIIGIDDYQYARKLTGCVADATAIEKYLLDHESQNFNIKIQKRLNSDATRANIVNDFTKHLAAATEKDVAFVFFAGHGAQEQADPSVWVSEPDQRLEGLVLYDSITRTDQNKSYKFLADKELRYLLHFISTRNEKGEKKKSPHIVVITDCCHSGENTRGGSFDEKLVTRAFSAGAPVGQREWKDFIFAKDSDFTPEIIASKPIDQVFPLVPHIAMAACQSNEEASEHPDLKRGVFTLNLIDVLTRSEGQVTYRDLQNRIANYIKNQWNQIPQIYASTDKNDLFKVFLGKKGGSKPMYANVQFNKKTNRTSQNVGIGWMMDIGAIHGVSNQTKNVKIVSFDNKISVDATIAKISPTSTTLTVADASKLDEQAQYKGLIEGFLSAPIAVFIDNLDGNKKMENDLRDLIEKQGKNLNMAAKENIADYAVRIFDGKYVMTNRVDTDPKVKYKPLVLPTSDADLAFDDLNHISQFEYVKKLENTGNNKMNLDSLTIEFFEKGKTTATPIKMDKGREIIEINYDAENITITITNNDDKPVYACLLGFTSTFGIMTDFLHGNVQFLEKKGEKVKVWDGDPINLIYEPHLAAFNMPYSDTVFKLIITRDVTFDVSSFAMDDLPSASELLVTKRSGIERGKKPVSAEAEAADAWVTRTIILRNPNPNFDKDYKNKPADFDSLLNTEGGAFLKKLY